MPGSTRPQSRARTMKQSASLIERRIAELESSQIHEETPLGSRSSTSSWDSTRPGFFLRGLVLRAWTSTKAAVPFRPLCGTAPLHERVIGRHHRHRVAGEPEEDRFPDPPECDPAGPSSRPSRRDLRAARNTAPRPAAPIPPRGPLRGPQELMHGMYGG